MKIRFPLYAKILLWFFLNLVLLGSVLYGFFHYQMHVGLDYVLAGPAGERLESLAQVIEDELREAPRSEWENIIKRFDNAYKGVSFYLFRPNGTQLTGESIAIPQEIRSRLPGFRTQASPPVPYGYNPPPWREHMQQQIQELQKQQQELQQQQKQLQEKQQQIQNFQRNPGQGGNQQRRQETNPPRPQPHPKFMVRTENPVRYWVGIRLPAVRRNATPVETEILFAVSSTLSGGGLFFDAGPWLNIGLAALVFSILFWLPLVRSITRGISQITRATEQVAEGNFDVRVDAARRDELGRLGQGINAMTERLAGFVGGQKRFLGDAAHELCSPLARIEVALSILESRAGAALQPRIADVREEAREMASLVNEILAFSKASLRGNESRLEPVPLAALARRVAHREAPDNAQVCVEIPDDLLVLGTPGLLGRAVANLVRNAVRYAGDASPIVVRAGAQNRKVALTVTDAGTGIPEEDLQKIFDPFYRLDTSRSRETGGFGLGLSIVKTCAQACGGSVTARNMKPSGLQVEIILDLVGGNETK